MDEFPPNSKTPPAEEEVKFERVTSTDPKRRKKPLGKQFRQTFISGDGKTAAHYVVFNVLLPGIKDMIYEAGSGYLEKRLFGDSRPRRGPSPTHLGTFNYTKSYQTQSAAVPPTLRGMSRRAKALHDFDDIVLETRGEAEDVLERLHDALDRYDSVSVADLYVLIGEKASPIDHTWGWITLRGSSVSRLRNQGWLLDLPDPVSLK